MARARGTGTLMDYGVLYDEAPLLPDMTPDYALIARKAPGAKVCHIQRSRGYLSAMPLIWIRSRRLPIRLVGQTGYHHLCG